MQDSLLDFRYKKFFYWESYLQDSLLDLFYKGISTWPVCQCARIPIIGSLKYRILYQTFSKKESLLEVLPAGFSITPPQ